MTIEQYDIRSPAAADTKADNNSPTLASSATGTPMNKSNSVIQTTKFFEEWSDKAPAIHRGQVITGNEKKYSTKLTETALFGAFENHLQSVLSDMERLPHEFAEERAVYSYRNHESSPISDVEIKPDGVLFYTRTPKKTMDSVHIIFEAKASPNADSVNEVLGQIGVYAETVWKAQFTRKFVPPSDKFGHIVDVSKTDATYLSFGGTHRNATVALATSKAPRVVKVSKTICQQADVYRRVGYICDTKFEKKKAVLKLSWTPVSRIPEGAVYDVLRLNGVEGIPEIYSSGIICADFLGNRLEYIIMEHCGDSLTTYFDGKCRPNELPQNERRKKLANIVQDVSACLVQAYSAGVLHRDVSMGNIAISGDKVFVIDW
ncbi:hypothetical protein GGI11_005450, partial [Coemansia sp. RSA 2049]